MKRFIPFLLVFLPFFALSQTIAEKSEFIKFMNYCQTPIEITAVMRGEVSVVKYNSDYSNLTTYYAQPNGDWMAKYPFVIKWYPIGTQNTVSEAYQHQIIAYFKVKVPRVYCTSKTAYLELFRLHWKNGDMQSGWHDSHYIPMIVKF